MNFLPVHHYRGSDDLLDRFFGDQLHLFDPWNDTQSTELGPTPESFCWINEPRHLNRASSHDNENQQHEEPGQSEKFRVQLNVAGFDPHSIKTHVESRKVIVEAKQEDRQPDGDFHIQELRKTYELPEHADVSHVASCVTPYHILNQQQNLAQFGEHRDPLFDYSAFLSSPFQPHIVDSSGQKELQLTMPMLDFHPEQIRLSVKNNNLIVQSERKSKNTKDFERSFFFQTVTLPPVTQTKQLQSHLTTDGELKIEVPFAELKPDQKIC
ncbi:unnamed protein product [Rotaria socialis]|uniref:SHSP domain-containing protein n=1 Tax=Rotaria socialis TaxID=392032 RepID=A0A817YGI2_9BILA|nr:unnamed protein product [Rotaria socialis]